MSGNIEIKETERVGRALRYLKRALPATWSVAIAAIPNRVDEGLYRPDAMVRILSSANEAAFAARFLTRPRSKGDTRHLIQRARSHSAGVQPLFIIPFANPLMRETCEEYGVSYLDETGWVYLRDDQTGMFVTREGANKSPVESRQHSTMRRLNGPGASAVIRALWDSELPIGVRALAEQATVSAGTSAKVLPELAEYGAIERSGQGEVTAVDRRLLLDRWAVDYQVFTSNKEVRWFLASRGPADAYNRLLKLQAQNSELAATYTGYQAVLTALPGKVYPVIPESLMSVYTPDPEGLASSLNLKPVPRPQANVVLIRPRDETLLDPNRSYAPLPQALVDLLTMGGRYPELVDQVLHYVAEQK